MRRIYSILTFIAIISLTWSCDHDPVTPGIPQNPADTALVVEEPADNIYRFKVRGGDGDSVSLAQYKDKVLLVVNTATRCGYTPQYTQLEQWYQEFKDQGFEILDFPCNQFGGQAPGDYDDIHGFCTDKYNITFPQFDKIYVNGPNASPLYVWLKSKKTGDIKWNFTKFLINRDGEVVERFETAYSMTKVKAAIAAEVVKE